VVDGAYAEAFMRGLIVDAGLSGTARIVDDLPEPDPADGEILVEAIAVGICGTDREIVRGEYGEAPPDGGYLVLGHESLGRVLEDPSRTLAEGDLVAGIVRRPDPEPCSSCAVGEWDMCRNGGYLEAGIKAKHGYGRERWRVPPRFAVRLNPDLGLSGVLLEPASVVAKAWEHIERIGRRAQWHPRIVLVTGAGPIGMLSALLGVQRDLEVHVLDRMKTGRKPDLVKRLGATYHDRPADEIGIRPDIVLECTGADEVVVDAISVLSPDGIACLTGVSTGRHPLRLNIGTGERRVVLENNVVFGSVNANRRHWRAAAAALHQADPAWLDALITRREPLDQFAACVALAPDDIKNVLLF
jgi:threonine dehydrogenase-like Zn-dependent dehydrogenase